MRSDWDERTRANWIKAIVGRDLPTDEFWAGGSELLEDSLRTLSDMGITPGHGVAVDFGCGAGRITLPLARHFDQVTGLDVSPEMADLARTYLAGAPNASIDVIEGESIPLPDNSVDFLWSWAVFQHLPSNNLMERILDEVCRVLKPNGVLFIEVPTLTGMYMLKGIPVLPRRWRDQVPTFVRRAYLSANRIRADRTKPTWRGGASMIPSEIEQRLKNAGVTPYVLPHEKAFKKIVVGTKN
ncbi:MAG: class I SAM-dependent methyltransferase [Chloroflexi bacterium]|nr:class I SAM-dependent methyltransferase [Chloroflexota bacterium]